VSSWCRIEWLWEVENGESFLDGSPIDETRTESRDFSLHGYYKAKVTPICHMPSNTQCESDDDAEVYTFHAAESSLAQGRCHHPINGVNLVDFVLRY
jgi:hypothetical protein